MAVVLTCRVVHSDPDLLRIVAVHALAAGRPAHELHLQALLQLPRLADEQGDVPLEIADGLLAELAVELPQDSAWITPRTDPSPRSLRFRQIPVTEVRELMETFHYLRSPRMDGRAYCLSTRTGRLVAFCVSSPLDVKKLADLLRAKGLPSGSTARVVSRVFAFEDAPRNTLSYLLARAARAERNLGVMDLITYVNPNMGFTGSSYAAAGWDLLGREPGTKYRYLDGRYVTDRVLAAAFGQHTDEAYRELLGGRFGVSVMPLAPLIVFARRIA